MLGRRIVGAWGTYRRKHLVAVLKRIIVSSRHVRRIVMCKPIAVRRPKDE
jgi:hypothetical protein